MKRKNQPKKLPLGLEGKKIDTSFLNKGLGETYYETMNNNKKYCHQIDVHTGLAETNGAVLQRAIQVATKMKENNITNDDIVVICSKSHADQTIAVLSSLLIGAIIAPIDPDLSHRDSFCLIQKLKPKMVFCDIRAYGQIERVLAELNRLHLCAIALFNADHTDRMAFERLLSENSDVDFEVYPVTNIHQKVAFIVPSQGATGVVKLICISHFAILFETYISRMMMKNVQRILSFFPLSWLAQIILMCSSFTHPITRILPGSFGERNACKIIRDMKVDHAILGTEYAIKIAYHTSAKDYDLSCLKCVLVGGYSTTALDISQLRDNLRPATFIQFYGTSETGCVCALLEQENEETLKKPASIGKLLPGVKIRVVEIKSRLTLGPDKWGELLVKSQGSMLGYYRDTGMTVAAMEKGFFKTGDLAQYDKEGYLYIQCRINDLIQIRDISFSPLEVEDIIISHPFVHEAVVIADGKEMVACVVKKKDFDLPAELLMSYIAESLPTYKCPNRIIFFDKFPKTSIGKVKKNELRNLVFRVTIKHSKSLSNTDLLL